MHSGKYTADQVKVLTKRESEVWIYSYADLITNLMAFFILLLTLKATDAEHAEKIKESFTKLVGQAPVPGQISEAEFAQSISEMIERLPQSYQVAVQRNAEGVSLSFMGGLFFETLSTDLSPRAQEILNMLAPIIVKMPKKFRVDVSGHSDARPILNSDGSYPSNWELSAGRAGAVVRYLEEHGVPSARMRAIGYGSTKPVSKNMDQNRRVVINIGRGVLP